MRRVELDGTHHRGRSRPVRVTMIGSIPPSRGVSAYTSALAAAIARRDDVDLDVVAFRSLYPALLYPGGKPGGGASAADHFSFRVARSLTWWNPFTWLVTGLRLRGDVVHGQWWSFFLAPAYIVVLAIARLRGKRVVLTMHNTEPHERGILRRIANRVVLPAADHVIVHAETNRSALTRQCSSISIVPMGCTPRSDVRTREQARNALGLPRDGQLVLFCGHIRAYKGADVLIEAFIQVAGTLRNAHLLIAGQVWRDAADIEHLVGAAAQRIGGRVHSRFGYLSEAEMADCYAAADVVVFPYRVFDAQSAAACDALSYGRAIVVTRAGGLPELVDDDAAAVPPSDPASLASAIHRVLTDASLRARLEQGAARRSVAQTWDVAAAATAAVYDSLAGNTPAMLKLKRA